MLKFLMQNEQLSKQRILEWPHFINLYMNQKYVIDSFKMYLPYGQGTW